MISGIISLWRWDRAWGWLMWWCHWVFLGLIGLTEEFGSSWYYLSSLYCIKLDTRTRMFLNLLIYMDCIYRSSNPYLHTSNLRGSVTC